MIDLDETMLHSEPFKTQKKYDLTLSFSSGKIGVFLRLFLAEFLEQLSQIFEIVLYTSSKETYVQKILQKIDPNKIYFKQILNRKNCVLVNG